jgi:hypothetical protein
MPPTPEGKNSTALSGARPSASLIAPAFFIQLRRSSSHFAMQQRFGFTVPAGQKSGYGNNNVLATGSNDSFRIALTQGKRVCENLIQLACRGPEIFRIQVRISGGHAEVLVAEELTDGVEVSSLHP